MAIILCLGMVVSPAFGQVPADLEKGLDRLNAEVFEALKILNTASETDAIAQLAAIKPAIKARADALKMKIRQVPELSEEEDQAFTQKQLSKPLYKDMMALLTDEAFNTRISSSMKLADEYNELLALLDLEEEEEIEPPVSSEACYFLVAPKIPNSGAYHVTAPEGEAFGSIDDAGYMTIEIYGESRGHEMLITILIDEPKPGKYQWTTEGQIYLQSQDSNGDEFLLLQNYHEEGYIILEKMEGVGGKITGSFKGLFLDDMEQTTDPVPVEGRFSVVHLAGAY